MSSATVQCTLVDACEHQNRKNVAITADMTLQDVKDLASAVLQIRANTIHSASSGRLQHLKNIKQGDILFVSSHAPEAKKAENEDDEDAINRRLFSIAVMGPGAVGKSAITMQFVRGVFVEDYDPTIEDAYRKTTMVDGEVCEIEVIDTAGQEDYQALRSAWMRHRDGFVLVYNVNDRTTFEAMESFYQQMINVYEEAPMPPLILVANKCDLAPRLVSTQEGALLAKAYHASYIETSAKTALNVEAVFSTAVRLRRIQKRPEPIKPKRKWWCTIL